MSVTMDLRFKALSVQLLTATGAVLSMFAMLAAVEEQWSLMFLWLVLMQVMYKLYFQKQKKQKQCSMNH